jgi:hypothetical protein
MLALLQLLQLAQPLLSKVGSDRERSELLPRHRLPAKRTMSSVLPLHCPYGASEQPRNAQQRTLQCWQNCLRQSSMWKAGLQGPRDPRKQTARTRAAKLLLDVFVLISTNWVAKK